jgi:tetratricopeptide (TPR) repeat protein
VENIPLNEAVARGIIPCSVCGASGADVRKVGDKNHFLCPRCARRGRIWTVLLVALTVTIVAVGGYVLHRRGNPPSDPGPGPGPLPKDAMTEDASRDIVALMDTKRWAEARARIQGYLDPMPKHAGLNLLMGNCLMGLKAYDLAVPYLKIAYDAGPPTKDQAALWLGLALKTIGYSAEALKYVEPVTELNRGRRDDLAEVYLDLERYEDALKILSEEALWGRHRALVYLGRGEEAKKLIGDRDPFMLAGQLREEGDFAGAARVLATTSGDRRKRAEMSLAVESGDLSKLDDDDPFFKAIGALLAGQKDKAKAAAWEFLAKTDKEFAPLRLERMMMRHLVGELKDADLEAEVRPLSRFHANDVLFYLALATGDRAWAEKAAASTPGHNYPYHAIQRLLKK